MKENRGDILFVRVMQQRNPKSKSLNNLGAIILYEK